MDAAAIRAKFPICSHIKPIVLTSSCLTGLLVYKMIALLNQKLQSLEYHLYVISNNICPPAP